MFIKSLKIIGLMCLGATLPGVARGQESDLQAKELLLLHAPLEVARKTLVDISSELLVLRETTQFPERSQVVVFLTMDKLPRFQLESIELQVDDKVVSNYNYTSKEKDAIQKGGFQRLYLGNASVGAHTVKALFKGKMPGAQEYSGSVSYNFRKAERANILTLGIYDFLQDNTPEMTIRENR